MWQRPVTTNRPHTLGPWRLPSLSAHVCVCTCGFMCVLIEYKIKINYSLSTIWFCLPTDDGRPDANVQQVCPFAGRLQEESLKNHTHAPLHSAEGQFSCQTHFQLRLIVSSSGPSKTTFAIMNKMLKFIFLLHQISFPALSGLEPGTRTLLLVNNGHML